MKKKDASTDMQKVSFSTPFATLPWGLPSEFSHRHSVLRPDNSVLRPRKIFPDSEDMQKADEEILIEESVLGDEEVLEETSNDDIIEETQDKKNETQSFLGVGLKNPSKF